MRKIEKGTFDEERAFYGEKELFLESCKFDGPADGESAIKECRHIRAHNCYFNLRYPIWHTDYLDVHNSDFTEFCRAALWYSSHINITDSNLHGIKALRECSDVVLKGCDISSTEFGWSVKNIKMTDCSASGEYFMMRSENLDFKNVSLKGKYSFQYITNSVFEGCNFDTKDSLWHSDYVTVKDSVIKGEYFAWYANHLTLINCKIIGTQPICYCKNLKLIDCTMEDADLCFEKSEVEATILSPVMSIKNPYYGHISVPAVGEIIMDDTMAKGIVTIK